MAEQCETSAPMPVLGSRVRAGSAVAIAGAGVLFAVYLLTRPYRDGGDTVDQFASAWWLVSHICAMTGFVLLTWGVINSAALLGRSSSRLANGAAASFGLGTVLLLPYYGAETFALHVLGVEAVAEGVGGHLAVAESIRMQTWAVVLFGLGLIALAVAAALGAVALARTGGSTFAATLFASVWLLFGVQFFVPPPWRMGFGLMLLAGCVAFAIALLRLSPAGVSVDPQLAERRGP